MPRDRSFCFYYPENLEALQAAGAKVVTFRPTDGDDLPDCDALYMTMIYYGDRKSVV